MKKSMLFIAAATLAASATARDLKAELNIEHDLWWNAPEQPTVKFTVTDTLGNANTSSLTFYLTTDTDQSHRLLTVNEKLHIPTGQSQEIVYDLTIPAPGFYRCTIEDDGDVIKQFNIGYEPTMVFSLPDAHPDFDEFWARALSELKAQPGKFAMTLDKKNSGKLRNAFKVTMKSLDGETIKGMVYIPKKPGKYPAHIYYNGYGGKPWPFDVDGRPDWIEFVTSVRGQMYSEPDNTYGDYIRYNLDKPDEYYYKGAFMDAVRAIDFVEQLPQTDTANIIAEGGSQGGALTLAAAALGGGRLRAICPYIPFLTDYRDYFNIVPWPASAVKEAAKDLGLTDEQMYSNLTYFDIKNLARKITCPVLMGIGLQDPTCPPHTNMASYNLITSPKELIIYPTCGHTVDYSDWNPRRDKFLDKYLKK